MGIEEEFAHIVAETCWQSNLFARVAESLKHFPLEPPDFSHGEIQFVDMVKEGFDF